MPEFDLYQAIQAMVTVKAYPRPSMRYGESVCIAAVRLDRGYPEFCRLYPVNFRGLPVEQRFRKYQIIRFLARAPSDDMRPESLRVDVDSIQFDEYLRTWRERWPLLSPLVSSSLCEIYRRQRLDGTSLGMFRPAEVLDFKIAPDDGEWDEGQRAVLRQESFLPRPRRRPLERVPYRFQYVFRCDEPSCKKPHKLSVIDWEVFELYRKLRDRPHDERFELLRAKWLDELCATDRETYFFVGNLKKRRDQFQILGVVWPRRAELRAAMASQPLALTLF